MKNLFSLTEDERKLFIRIVLISLAVSILLSIGFKIALAQQGSYVPNKILVQYRPNTPESQRELFRTIYSLRLDPAKNNIPDTEVLTITDGKTPQQIAVTVKDYPIVVLAEPIYISKTQAVTPAPAPNDPFWGAQWYMNRIGMLYAWGDYLENPPYVLAKPTVAIIDTGLVPGNPDINYLNVVWGCDWIDPGTSCLKAIDPIYSWSHGTAIAGIIGAISYNEIGMAGISPNGTRLIIERVCDTNGNCPLDLVAQGVYHAMNLGAKIINLSMNSYDYSGALDNAIQAAATEGILVVCSMGNDGYYNVLQPNYPGIFKNCMTVGSTDENDRWVSVSSTNGTWGSNWGLNISVVAPGTDIFSLNDADPASVTKWDGTSMSTAEVSGLASLLLARCPGISGARLRWLIETGAVSPSALCTNGCGVAGDLNYYYGAGRINAYKSMTLPCYVPPRHPPFHAPDPGKPYTGIPLHCMIKANGLTLCAE